jgi:uncharacterized membrane protein
MKRQLIIFGLLHAVILLVLFRSNLYDNSSLGRDVAVFFDYSTKIVQGGLPYQEFTVEYPPMALAFFTLPRLVAPDLGAYQYAFAVEILLFDLLGLFLILVLSRRLGIYVTGALAIYTVALLAIGPILIYRYDLIPAVMVLASLYAFSRHKYKLSWAVLAIGVMTKIYPVVVAPILLIHQFCHRRYRDIVSGAVTFAIATAIIVIPGLLLSPAGFWGSWYSQAQRGLHADSTYSSFLLLGYTLGLTQVRIGPVGPAPFSIDVTSPLADTLATISPIIMIMAAITIYWFFYRTGQTKTDTESPPLCISQPDMANITNYSFLAILAFMLTNKVFSPQFIIWLYPIVPLITGKWRHASWLIFTLAAVLTCCLFPQHYSEFTRGSPQMIDVLLWRNVLLIVLAILLVEWRRPTAMYRS